MDQQVHKVMLDLQDLREKLVHKGILVFRVLQVHKVMLDLQVLKEIKVSRERSDQQVQ